MLSSAVMALLGTRLYCSPGTATDAMPSPPPSIRPILALSSLVPSCWSSATACSRWDLAVQRHDPSLGGRRLDNNSHTRWSNASIWHSCRARSPVRANKKASVWRQGRQTRRRSCMSSNEARDCILTQRRVADNRSLWSSNVARGWQRVARRAFIAHTRNCASVCARDHERARHCDHAEDQLLAGSSLTAAFMIDLSTSTTASPWQGRASSSCGATRGQLCPCADHDLRYTASWTVRGGRGQKPQWVFAPHHRGLFRGPAPCASSRAREGPIMAPHQPCLDVVDCEGGRRAPVLGAKRAAVAGTMARSDCSQCIAARRSLGRSTPSIQPCARLLYSSM